MRKLVGKRASQVAAVVWLVAIWMLLWGTLSWANLISGLVVAGVVVAVFPLPPLIVDAHLRPLGILRFVVRFLWDLVVSSLQVTREAFRFGRPPRNAVIAVPLRTRSDLHLTMIAESLSLIPGSLIVDVGHEEWTLYVHVLGVTDRSDVERFRREVVALEARVLRAIGSREELDMLREPSS